MRDVLRLNAMGATGAGAVFLANGFAWFSVPFFCIAAACLLLAWEVRR